MSTQDESKDPNPATTIGLILSLFVGVVWVIYGLTGAPQWLLVVGVVFTMLVGGWWAYGNRLMGTGRNRNRNRS